MNIASKLSGHWTDDQLIEHLYGVGPEDSHLEACPECQSRLSGMHDRQQAIGPEKVDEERLVVQRRQIYARITKPVGLYRMYMRRWAAAAAAALVVSGSLVYYQERQQQQTRDAMLSDAQLAQDVSRMSENQEAQPAAPLQALFQE